MRAGQHTLKRSFLWLGSASAFARVVDLSAIVLVIGLISPEQIGEASIAWTVITLSEPLAGFGMSGGLISVRQLDKLSLDSALCVSLAGGVAGALVVALLAPLVGWVSHAELVTWLIAVGGLKLVPAALAAVPQQRLARVLRHREIAAASAAATLGSALARVAFAFAGLGAWAFVLSQVLYSVFLLAALWPLAPMKLRIRIDPARTRELLRMGMPSALGLAVTQWARNIDYLFVGAFLGMAPLGLYRVAFDLAMEPVAATGDVVARSAAPTLRRLANSPVELAKGFHYALRLTLMLALPLALLVFGLAPHLLALIKDSSYTAAAGATRWLVVASVLRVVLGLYPALAMAIGKPRLSLLLSLELLVTLCVALAISVGVFGSFLSVSAAGVAWCVAVALVLLLARVHFRSAFVAPRVTAASAVSVATASAVRVM